MIRNKNFLLLNDEPGAGGGGDAGGGDAGGGTGDSFDMAAAVDEIGAGLGLDLKGTFDDPDNNTPPADGADPKPTAAPGAAPAPAATPPAPQPAPAAGTAPPPAPGVTTDLNKPPGSWTAASQAKWATIDPEVRAEIHKREADIFKGIESYKAGATFARTVAQQLQPVMPDLQRHNVAPEVFIGNLTAAHVQLSNPNYTPEQKAQLAAAYLKSSYGIDLTAGVLPAGQSADYVDPQVTALQQQVQELKSKLEGRENREAETVRTQLKQTIDSFAADPANIYFDEVADDIVLLLRGSGGKMDLKEAYDRAVYANPVTRAKEIARLQTESQAKAVKEAQEKAEAARKAANANVPRSRHQGQDTPAKGSMDDTMKETLTKIKSRAAA